MEKRAQLREFRVKGFKSYEEAALRLSPLTLLIGPNASGKSNLLEALRLLSWLARGQRIEQVFRAVQDGDVAVRGRMEDLPYSGRSQFQLGCSFAYGNITELSVTLRVARSDMRVVGESVEGRFDTVPLYRIEVPAESFSHDVQVAYNNFARGRNKPRITCSDQQLVLTQLGTPARFGKTHKKSQETIPAVTKAFSEALANILFLDPFPRRMRGYVHKVETALKEDGSNLSGVLHKICQDDGRKEQVLDFIRQLPEQDIRDIDFIQTPRDEVMVRLEESFAGKAELRDAPLLSDGTLRVLAIAAVVLSAPEQTVVVIEEVDNGVHPSRAEALLRHVQDVSKARSLSVLLTSHNPALLDALPLEAVPNVACCFRDVRSGASRLIHLRDLPSYPELIARGPLGRLMSKGVIERFLKDQRSQREKKEQALLWIDRVENGEQ
jgi:predicted ATPase